MSNKPNPNQQPAYDNDSAPAQAAISLRKVIIGMAVVVIVTAALAGYGILRRHQADAVLAERTTELAAPTVMVSAPKEGAPVGVKVPDFQKVGAGEVLQNVPRRKAQAIENGYHAAAAGPGQRPDGQPGFGEHSQHADLGRALSPAARQGQ